jgi:hypothetical protein
MKFIGKHDPAALAQRLRTAFAGRRAITEKTMFGGVCFLLREHMLCGTGKPGFMFRIGKPQHAKALARRGASPIVMKGRRLDGFVWVDADACDARTLRGWVALAEKYVKSLPAKKR